MGISQKSCCIAERERKSEVVGLENFKLLLCVIGGKGVFQIERMVGC